MRLVYCSFREDYPGLVRTFREVIEKLMAGSSEDRKKGKEISGIQGSILNLKFVLELSGACDIYNRFGNAINILQTVNILPHVKFDKFVAIAVDGLATMGETVDLEDCPCSKDRASVECHWPLLHKDVREISVKSTYRGVTITSLMSDELSTRAGRKRTKQNLLLNQEGIMHSCVEKLRIYSVTMGENFFSKVYQSEDKKLVESIRNLLDLETSH